MGALTIVGAYIDLNPVRAGLVDDPKDYLWSGYGAAVGGTKAALLGVEKLIAHIDKIPPKGGRALEHYRMVLYGAADAGDERTHELGSGVAGIRRGVSHKEAQAVRGEKGRLSRWEMLRCKVRYFTAGAVIGSRSFVNEVFQARREYFGQNRSEGARPMRGADFGELCTLRDLKVSVITG